MTTQARKAISFESGNIEREGGGDGKTERKKKE
jgi:hypothetical protein